MLFASFALFSCSQEEEIYSCDEAVNDWVKDNLFDIQKMTRSDWLNLDENVKQAAYVAFTPEQKQTFWLEKMQEVLLLGWNEVEKVHLESLYKMILDNPQWFSLGFSENKHELEKFELFTYKWVEYAKDDLEWDDILIFSITVYKYKLLDKTGRLDINLATLTPSVRLKNGSEAVGEGGKVLRCNCIQANNDCPNQNETCAQYPKTCRHKYGCGYFSLGTCDGYCQ